MTIEMSQFFAIFFEEAEEHLASMESLLLKLDVAQPDPDDLNAIFRAAHSIKGGAGTFGFGDMAEVTHVLENLLDKLRKSTLVLTQEMVDAFLSAGDVLKSQLDFHRGGSAVDAAAVAEICATLARLTDGAAAQACAHPADSAGLVTLPTTSRFQLTFKRVAKAKLEKLLAELAREGELQAVSEAGESKDVRYMLDTQLSETAVWEILEFVVNRKQVSLHCVAPAGVDEKPVAVVEEDDSFGFFEPLPAPAAQVEEIPGFGLFEAAPVAEPVMRHPGRRAGDVSEEAVVPGRRDTDRVAVAANVEASSIRVSIDKVDHLINLVGELVISHAMLAQTASRVDPASHESLLESVSQIERNTRDLQESVMSIRMLPVSFVFNRFPRVVRDVAAKLGKQVELKMLGETTEMDKGLIEKLSDPLTHLVRNSLDHGIETPETRIAAGKDACGALTLRAFHQGGNVVVEVSDDGAGLNREKILAKARERGMTVHDGASDQEVWQLIFEAGFSTAEVVTDVSGRGVGMDVVKRNILAMGGRIEIDSASGVGTRIAIRLPLTLAILDGMSVGVGKEIFIVPLTFIVESLQPRAEDIRTIGSTQRVVQVRGEYLPVLPLHALFHIKPKVTEPEKGIMVILETEGKKTALFVDELVGQHQIVIKSMETNYRKVDGISGATIMGNGKVALILDVDTLVRMPELSAAQGAVATV